MRILAIDPGNIESAYCLINTDTYEPIMFDKIKNEELVELIENNKYCSFNTFGEIIIEKIASYGMAVGQTIFDTCIWTGKFAQASGLKEEYILRKDEKMNLCHSMKAKDSNIRQALIDRFGLVGTKKNPRMVLWI